MCTILLLMMMKVRRIDNEEVTLSRYVVGVDLAPFWTTVFKAIDEERKKRGKLLLLCGMGISRSATFAIGYLMCIEK